MERSAGIVLFRIRDRQREYLLLHYKAKTEYWGLPKGRMESGEKEEETALREVAEETGLEQIRLISGFKEKTSYFFVREGKKIFKEVTWFLGEVLDTQDGKVSSEHDGLKWSSYEETLKMMRYEKDKSLVILAEKVLMNSA